MRSRFLRIACAIALLSCFIVGCAGEEFDRVSLSGTVTCEGNANPSGSILASPATSGTGAPNVGAPITDGKFSFPSGQEPVAGSYIFEISLLVPGEQPAPGESPEGEVETGPEVVYRKTIDVPEGGSGSLAIELTSADLVEGDSAGPPASGEI